MLLLSTRACGSEQTWYYTESYTDIYWELYWHILRVILTYTESYTDIYTESYTDWVIIDCTYTIYSCRYTLQCNNSQCNSCSITQYISQYNSQYICQYTSHCYLVYLSVYLCVPLPQGCGESECFSDTWAYSFVENQWQRVNISSGETPPQARLNAAGGVYPGSNLLWLSMGRSGQEGRQLSDTWVLNISITDLTGYYVCIKAVIVNWLVLLVI